MPATQQQDIGRVQDELVKQEQDEHERDAEIKGAGKVELTALREAEDGNFEPEAVKVQGVA